jgi:hypothetical protein
MHAWRSALPHALLAVVAIACSAPRQLAPDTHALDDGGPAPRCMPAPVVADDHTCPALPPSDETVCVPTAGGWPGPDLRPSPWPGAASQGEGEDVAALEAEARAHALNGQVDEAVAALRELVALDPERRCLHQTRVVATLLGTGADRELVPELNTMLHVVSDDSPMACRIEAARLLLATGETWMTAATAPGADEDERQRSFDLAEQSYTAVLTRFSPSVIELTQSCVDHADVLHARAELLLHARRWDECGGAFDEALASDARGRRGRDAAFGGVVCRQQAWLAGGRSLGRAPLLERIEAQPERERDFRLMLNAFWRLLCLSRGSSDADFGAREAALARAEAFYRAGALWEAAITFRALAFSMPGSRLGLSAAQRYVMVMAGLDTCRHDVLADAAELSRLYCAAGSGEGPCQALEEARHWAAGSSTL